MLFKIARRNLWRNKRRTLITAASVFLAVLLSVVLKGMKEGTYERMIDNMVGVFTGYVQVHEKGYWDEQTLDNSFAFTDTIEATIVDHKLVQGYIPRINSYTLTFSDTRNKGAMVVGTDPEREDELTKLRSKVVKGEYLEADDKALLLGKGLADYLKVDIGDSVIMMGQGYHGITANAMYPVKGIVKFPTEKMGKGIIYMPIKEAAILYGMEGRVTSLVLLLKENDKATKISRQLNRSLGSDFEVMTWEELTPVLKQFIQSDRVEGMILMGVLYMIIAFGIFGSMLMMLSERTHEFGVLVAIGMKRIKLAVVVFVEILLISFLGALAGVAVGFPINLYFNYYPIKFTDTIAEMYNDMGFEPVVQSTVDAGLFFKEGLIVFILVCIIAIYPLIKISAINAVDSMRS